MKYLIIGFICFVAGSYFGIIIMCIFQIGKMHDARMEEMIKEKINNEQNE